MRKWLLQQSVKSCPDTKPSKQKSLHKPFCGVRYQTRQAGLRIIGALGLQPKALAKADMFDTVPFTRYLPVECSFESACSRAV